MQNDNFLAGYSIEQPIRISAQRNCANIRPLIDARSAFRCARKLSNDCPNTCFKSRRYTTAKLAAAEGCCATNIV